MEKIQKKIGLRRTIAIGCFLICFVVFVASCVLELQFNGVPNTTFYIARNFWGIMTIVAAIGIAQAEIIFAVLYPEIIREKFSGKKFLFVRKKK